MTERTLAQCEAVIEGAYKRVQPHMESLAAALSEIRDRRLYKDDYGSWDTYCEQRWALTGRSANRQIEQFRALAELPSGVPKPSQREVTRKRASGARNADARPSPDDVPSPSVIDAVATPAPNKHVIDIDEVPEAERSPSTGVRRSQAAPAQGPDGNDPQGAPPLELPQSVELGGADLRTPQEPPVEPSTSVELTRQDIVRVIEWLNGRPLTWVDDVPLDVLRTHAVWAKNAERRGIARSAEATVAKHKAEQAATPRPLARRTVTPNFKGSSK